MRARHLLISSLFFSLFPTACGDDDGTAPAPENLTGELAYISDGIVILDLTTGETRRIALNTEGLSTVSGMSWQPDGRALVYGVFNDNRLWYELHHVPVNGSPSSVLFPGEGHHAAPAFLPDGRLSYWVNGVEVDGERRGYEIFVDGQPFSPPLFDGIWPGRAAWSPDGRSVVLARGSRLVKVTLATGEETTLVEPDSDQNDELVFNPVYSHAGDRLAFTRDGLGPTRDGIWVVNADGSNPRPLTPGHADDMATWSPDDAYIAFSRTEEPVASIGLVPVAGGPVSTLVRGAGVGDWR